MTRSRIDARLQAASLSLDGLRPRMDLAIRALADVMADGYPGGGEGGVGGIIVKNEDGETERVPTTGVEAAMFARARGSALWSETWRRVDELTACLDRLWNMTDEMVRFGGGIDLEKIKRDLRCTGGNVHPECANIASPGRRDGLCDRCRKAVSRQQVAAERAS